MIFTRVKHGDRKKYSNCFLRTQCWLNDTKRNKTTRVYRTVYVEEKKRITSKPTESRNEFRTLIRYESNVFVWERVQIV